MSNVHDYPVTVSWSGGREGEGTIKAERSGVQASLSVPPEFQGPGAGTNPEELLTAAIAGCYSITYGIVATNRKLPIKNVIAEAIGQVEQTGPTPVYKSIVIRPKITIDASATEEQVKLAEEMAHKADLYCIITNAVRDKVQISVEPEIVKN